MWELYWLLRESTSADSGIDLEAALRLHDRLYGGTQDMIVLRLLQACDRAFQRFRSEQLSKVER